MAARKSLGCGLLTLPVATVVSMPSVGDAVRDPIQGKEAEVAAMGGKFSVDVDREKMSYNATVLKADVPKAMEVLAAAVKVHMQPSVFVSVAFSLFPRDPALSLGYVLAH